MNIIYFLLFAVVSFLLWSSLRREKIDNVPKSDLPAQAEVQPLLEPEHLSAEEAYALALGDLEYERLSQDDLPGSVVQYLQAEWGLSFDEDKAREHAIYTLQHIWSSGSISLVFQNVQFEQNVSIKELIAFDSARFVELLRQVMLLGFLDEEEAWGLLFLNAQRVQDSFENWADFKEAYFRGLTLYRYNKLEEKEQKIFDFDAVLSQTKGCSSVDIVWLEEPIFSHFKRVEI